MTELSQQLQKTREHIAPRWTLERERRVQAACERKLGGRRQPWMILAAATAAIAIALASFNFARSSREAPRESAVAVPAPNTLLKLTDGSDVTSRSSDTRIAPVEVTSEVVTLRLEAGSARFSVTPNPTRTFRVLAGDVTVTVLGTVFVVGYEPGGVRVQVERGRVRVDGPGGESTLEMNQSALVPARETAEPAPLLPAPDGPASEEKGRAPVSANRGGPGPSWRALARDGDYQAALTRLKLEGNDSVRDVPEDLLLAADVARLGGQPDRAVAPLSRIIAAHASDSRAPLAAFTLGRTLLDQLGRPRQAAKAFSTAQRLDTTGSLSEDALAREVESWSRAGETEQARARAEAYLSRYPNGRRTQFVRRLGGVD
jgi:transmembrane sensor